MINTKKQHIYNSIIIFLIPIILYLLLPNIFYQGFYSTDNCFYLGYFFDYPKFLKTFPYEYTYYQARLGHIIPGYIYYQIFSPLVAHFLFHFTIIYLFIFVFYKLISDFISARIALLISTFLLLFPLSILAFSDDYPTGTVMVYFILSFFFLIKSFDKELKNWHWKIFISGIFCALMIHSQIISMLYMLTFLFAFYIFYNKYSIRRSLFKSTLWFVAGGLLITIILGLINFIAGGDFLFFIKTIQWTPVANKEIRDYWEAYKYTRFLYPYNVFALLIFIVSIYYLVKNKKRLSLFSKAVFLSYIINFSILILMIKNIFVFAQTHYYPFLIPQLFIVLACIVYESFERIKTEKNFYIMMISGILILGMIFFIPIESIYGYLFIDVKDVISPCNAYIKYLLLYDAVIILFFLPIIIFNKRPLLLFLSCLLPVMILLNINSLIFLRISSRETIKTLFQLRDEIEKFDSSKNVYFWLNNSKLNQNPRSEMLYYPQSLYLSATYLCAYRTIGYEFPNLCFKTVKGPFESSLFSGQRIILFNEYEDPKKDRLWMLNKASEALLPRGLKPKFIKELVFDKNNVMYFIELDSVCSTADIKSETDIFSYDRKKDGFSKKFQKCTYLNIFSIKDLLISKFCKMADSNISVYKPSSLKDHITTNFLVIPENRKGDFLCLKVKYDPTLMPSELLDFKIQNENYHNICEIPGYYIFRKSFSEYMTLIKLPENTKSVRLNISSRDGVKTYMPDGIELSIASLNSGNL